MFLRQSTASQEILLGPFLDDTTGKDAEVALSIANTDIKIWKHGGTTEASKNSGGATHIASGRYYAVLDATDTDTIGNLEINVHVSGALPVRRQFVVLDEAVYDVLYGTTALSTYAGADTSGTTTLLSRIGGAITITSGRVNADVTHIAAAAVSTSTAQLGVNVVNAGGTAWGSGAITAASIAADAITDAKVASDVTIASVTGAVGSVTGAVGSVTGNVGGNVVGSVASVTAAVTADVTKSMGFGVMAYGTVTTGASTTSVPTSACTPSGAVADQFKNRTMIFTNATTTAALRSVAVSISASSNAAEPTFTVGTLPATPASGDTFVIV